MGGWHYEDSGEHADRSWFGRQHNGWIAPLVFVLLLMIFMHSGAWWMIFLFWWIIPAFGGWNKGCANRAEKYKRDAAYEKTKRNPVYIYSEHGEPLEVVETPEKPKRRPDDPYDYI